jgi:peptidoglycan hydrolase-like protein with peptidoglycan-binding domain
MIAAIQRLAGNRSATRLIESSPPMPRRAPDAMHRLTLGRPTSLRGAVLQRQGEGPAAAVVPAAASKAPQGTVAALGNKRFAALPRLQAIAAGDGSLGPRDPRLAIRAVQQALVDVGYSLLRFQTDGRFGTETTEAIRQFRVDHRMAPDGGLDATALLELDRVAPAAGVALEHYVDYDRLFADNKFDVTLAIGYDDPKGSRKGLHEQNIKDAHAWLEGQHFERVTATNGDAATGPTELWRSVRKIGYPSRSGDRVEREITINFRLILPGKGAAAAFGQSLNESELTMYAGHARRGIGPDFDEDKSKYENFVLGVNSALHKAGRLVSPTAVERAHYVVDKKNDLEEMGKQGKWDKEKYRIWFFNACSTIAYMDELRGGLLPAEMDRTNLDVFGTTTPPATFQVLSKTSLAMLEGILNAETMEEILRHMDRVGMEAMRSLGFDDRTIRASFKAMPYFREGAGDNPVAQPAP